MGHAGCVLGGIVGRDEHLVQVALAGTTAFIDTDCRSRVSRLGSNAGGCKKVLRINSFSEAIVVCGPTVARTLYFNIERRHVVIIQVDGLGAGAFNPLAIVARDQRLQYVGRAEGVAAIGGVGAGDAGREQEADQGKIRHVGDRVRNVCCDINVPASWSDTWIQQVANVIGAAVGQDAAVVGLTLVLEGQSPI